MDENNNPAGKRQIWVRGFFMLLMIMIFQVAGTLILCIAVFQFIMMLVTGNPNARLQQFSLSLARYVQQLASFLTFGAEEIPFPFSDWPAEKTGPE